MRALPLVCLIGSAVVALASCVLPSRSMYQSEGIRKSEDLSSAAGHEHSGHGVARSPATRKATGTEWQRRAKIPQPAAAPAPVNLSLPVKAQIVRCAQRVYGDALSCPGPDQPGTGAIRNNTTGVVTNIDGRGGGLGAVPEATQPARSPAATFFNAGMQLNAVGNAQAANTGQNNQSASYDQAQDGRDLLPSRPLALTDAMPSILAPIGEAGIIPVSLSEAPIEPQAAGVNTTRPAAGRHDSYLDRAFKGAVKGIMFVAFAALYLVVRAFVRKFRARNKGAATVAVSGATPSAQHTTEQTAWVKRAMSIFYTRTFWQLYLACVVMGVIAMLVGGGADSGPINLGRFGEIDSEAGRLTLLDVIAGSAVLAAVICWLFPD